MTNKSGFTLQNIGSKELMRGLRALDFVLEHGGFQNRADQGRGQGQMSHWGVWKVFRDSALRISRQAQFREGINKNALSNSTDDPQVDRDFGLALEDVGVRCHGR